jgi:hypothetical protein
MDLKPAAAPLCADCDSRAKMEKLAQRDSPLFDSHKHPGLHNTQWIKPVLAAEVVFTVRPSTSNRSRMMK